MKDQTANVKTVAINSPKEEKLVHNLGEKLRQKLNGTTPTKPNGFHLSRAKRRALGIK